MVCRKRCSKCFHFFVMKEKRMMLSRNLNLSCSASKNSIGICVLHADHMQTYHLAIVLLALSWPKIILSIFKVKIIETCFILYCLESRSISMANIRTLSLHRCHLLSIWVRIFQLSRIVLNWFCDLLVRDRGCLNGSRAGVNNNKCYIIYFIRVRALTLYF